MTTTPSIEIQNVHAGYGNGAKRVAALKGVSLSPTSCSPSSIRFRLPSSCCR